MKKFLFVVCCLFLTTAVFAQWVPPSLQSALSGGAFTNEIDNAFNASTNFGSYDQQFMFGGLGNPYATELKDPNDPSQGLHIEDTATVGDWLKAFYKREFGKDRPFQFGWYLPGKIPTSYFGSFGTDGLLPAAVLAGPTKVETTWDNTDHTKVINKTTTSHTWKPLFQNYSFSFQTLVGLGFDKNIVTGLYFYLEGDDSNYDPADFTKKVYKDIEHPENNYVEKDYNKNNKVFKTKFTIGIPLAIRLANLNHKMALTIDSDLDKTITSAYLKDNTSTAKGRSRSYGSLTTLGLNYSVDLPVKEKESDAWIVGMNVSFLFGNKQGSLKQQQTGSINMTKKSYTRSKPNLGFELGLRGARHFEASNASKSVLFSMEPELAFNLYTGQLAKDDLKDSGYDTKTYNYTNNGGTETTKTTVTTGSLQKYKNTTELLTKVSIPMGLKMVPKDWAVGFLLGATPSAECTITAEFDRSAKHKTPKTTTTLNGTETTIGGDAYNAASYTSGGSRSYEWKFEEKHSLGLTFVFEGGAHLDMVLNGKNITEINDFVIQAFIPLGAPKKNLLDKLAK